MTLQQPQTAPNFVELQQGVYRDAKMRILVIGNGESREWFKPCHQMIDDDVVTWGCNALYRDGKVDNLVAVDYGMQQEIYSSGYPLAHTCWFADWNVLPSQAAEMMLMTTDVPQDFIHQNRPHTEHCVIQGKDPITLQEKIDEIKKKFPNLRHDDLKMKLEKDVGIWITWVREHDMILPVEEPKGWSAGNTALSLACSQAGSGIPIEVYILGYDLSSYDKDLNNIYKGTDNYLPATAKGFNPINWMTQMEKVFDKYKVIDFYWVDRQFDEKIQFNNVKDLTKTELCDILHII
jgi:hypothetical protein